MFGRKINVVKLRARISDYDASREANGMWVFENITLIDDAGDKVFFRHLNISKDDYALVLDASPSLVTLYTFTMPIGRNGDLWAEVYAVKHGEVRSMRRGAHKASRMMVMTTTKRYTGLQPMAMVFVFTVLWFGLWYAGYQLFDHMGSGEVMMYSWLAVLAFYVQPLLTISIRGGYGKALALVEADGFNPKGESWRAAGNAKYC